MEDNEIHYFFDSFEDALKVGVRNIITEFIKKQIAQIIRGFIP
jgi:hypothetical protein